MKLILVIPLFGMLAVAFLWERTSIARLRVENESLRVEKLEADHLAEENRDLPKLRAAVAGASAERGPSTELLRLRNEVRRLRGQQPEIARLRAENERIRSELNSGKFNPRRLADLEGFIPRENWASAGFATPEAAAQSFFAAIASGDLEQLLRCASPEAAKDLRQQIQEDPEQFQREQREELGRFAKVSGFRVAERRQLADDRIVLSLQFSAEGEAMPLPLRRVGSEWKIDKE